MRMNNNHWCLIVSLFALYSQGLERVSVVQEDQMPAEFPGIPAKELEIYKNYNRKQRAHLNELLVNLGNTFLDSAIPARRERKFKKQLARYHRQQKNTLFKGIISAAAAGGFGYCARKGCTIPETTAGAAVAGIGFGLLTMNFMYDWYNLPRPTYESIAEQLDQKINNCPDWRPIVARKIKKICVPTASKENK